MAGAAGSSASSAPVTPVRLATRQWAGPPVATVLIHGICDGAFVWDPLLPHLLQCCSVTTVDLRGHGDSPWDPLGNYRPEAHVADMVALIDGLDQSPLVLAGHSLGAEVAIRAAAARPHRVSKLVIVDGGPDLNGQTALTLREHLRALEWRYTTIADFAALLQLRHPLADPAILERYASSALRRADDHGFELKADPALRVDLPLPDDAAIWRALDSLTCRKLLVRGSGSAVLSKRSAESTSQRLRNCRLETVAQAGHSIPLDNPVGLCDAIKGFLARAAP